MSVSIYEERIRKINEEINQLQPSCDGTKGCPDDPFCGSINFSACGRISLLKSARIQEGRELAQLKKSIPLKEKARIAKIETDRIAKIENDRLAIIENERLRGFEIKRLADIEKSRILKLQNDKLLLQEVRFSGYQVGESRMLELLNQDYQELENFYELDLPQVESIPSVDSVDSIDSMTKQIPLETVTPVLAVLGIGLVSYYLLKGNKK